MWSLLFPPFVKGRGAVGQLVLRAVVGAAFVWHGWGKVQNAFMWMDKPNDPSSIPGVLQALAAVSEFGGGILLILGLLTPLAALALVGMMIGALKIVHLPASHPFVASNPRDPSYEVAAAYLAVNVAILCLGPGVLSADALLFRRKVER